MHPDEFGAELGQNPGKGAPLLVNEPEFVAARVGGGNLLGGEWGTIYHQGGLEGELRGQAYRGRARSCRMRSRARARASANVYCAGRAFVMAFANAWREGEKDGARVPGFIRAPYV